MATKNGKHRERPGDFVTIRGAKVWKAYGEMSTAELRAATAEFDKEFIADTFKPMTASERRAWTQKKRGRGRPKVGKGAKVISVSIEKGLLTRIDRLAKKANLSRAQLIRRGLETLLDNGADH